VIKPRLPLGGPGCRKGTLQMSSVGINAKSPTDGTRGGTRGGGKNDSLDLTDFVSLGEKFRLEGKFRHGGKVRDKWREEEGDRRLCITKGSINTATRRESYNLLLIHLVKTTVYRHYKSSTLLVTHNRPPRFVSVCHHHPKALVLIAHEVHHACVLLFAKRWRYIL
jgi:hypothetical protein